MPDTLVAPETDAPVVASVAGPKDDPWTSQSATSGSNTTVDAADDEPPAGVAKSDETPAEAEARERNDKGQFTSATEKADKKPSKRTNPYEAVKAATGETAREREAREKAEARAADLQRQLDDARRQPAKPEAEPPGPKADAKTERRPKPSPDEIGTKYASWEDYNEDLLDWKLEGSGPADIETRIRQALATERAEVAHQTRMRELTDAARQKYPDYDQAIAAADASGINFSGAHFYAMSKMPDPIGIQYALAKDLDAAKRIAALDNPIDLSLALAQLILPSGVAASPDSTSTARPSTAKPPISRVGGTASAVAVDPDDLEFGPEFMKADAKRDEARKHGRRW